MKLLMGRELAGFLKESQFQAVRTLNNTQNIVPRLAIIKTIDNPAIDLYVRLKQQYARDVGIIVDLYNLKQSDVSGKLKELNSDHNVHGIIIQLPLKNPKETENIVNLVSPHKDVDALGQQSKFEPATPMAILWLLSGFNIDLQGKKIVLVGRGKLVGAPLEKILLASGLDVQTIDSSTKDTVTLTHQADILITATGRPGIISSDMIKQGAVVVDAGVASEDGKTVGDVDPRVYERDDLTITPRKGGVGPLTICALFDNVIRAASLSGKL